MADKDLVMEVVIYSITDSPKVIKNVISCYIKTLSGDIEVLPSHAPIVTIVKNNVVKIMTRVGQPIILQNFSGMVKVTRDKVQLFKIVV